MVEDRQYVSTGVFRVDKYIYANGYIIMENGERVYIKKTMEADSHGYFNLPNIIAVFKRKK